MSMSCKKYRKLIEKGLLDHLDDQDRRAWEIHLAGCSSCRQYLQAHSSWTSFASEWQKNQEQIQAPDGLNARIMYAVRREKARQSQEALPARRSRAAVWNRLASIAVAALVLAVGLQFMLGQPARQTGDKEGLVPASVTTSANTQKSFDTTDAAAQTSIQTTAAPGIWQIGGQGLEGKTAINTIINRLAESVASQDYSLSFLDDAKATVIFSRQQPDQTIILAAFTSEDIQRKYDAAKTSFSSCGTLVRIEIIRIEDLPSLVDGFSTDLLSRSVATDLLQQADLSWILILIGE